MTAVFTRFTLHSFERKESRRGYKRKFYSPYLFFPLFGLTYNTRSSKSETAIRNNLRDYLSRRNGGAEGNHAQAGDCVRETCTDWLVSCQSLERRMCVSRGTNSRVSADDRCVSVARLEKAVPRTTRKLFTAHLSRPRSRCTSHVYVYWRIAKILATTSKYSVARTPYLRHGDFSSRTESQLERDICHKSRIVKNLYKFREFVSSAEKAAMTLRLSATLLTDTDYFTKAHAQAVERRYLIAIRITRETFTRLTSLA